MTKVSAFLRHGTTELGRLAAEDDVRVGTSQESWHAG